MHICLLVALSYVELCEGTFAINYETWLEKILLDGFGLRKNLGEMSEAGK